mgnify:CR=1 FL=1
MKYPFFNLPDWNQTSPTQRTDLAQELSENLPNFEFTDIQLCEFGKQKILILMTIYTMIFAITFVGVIPFLNDLEIVFRCYK